MDDRYSEHDDRTGGPFHRGGGGYRGGRPYSRGGRGRGNRGRPEVNPRTRLEDDFSMGSGDEGAQRVPKGRFRTYYPRRGRSSSEYTARIFNRLGDHKSSVFQRLSGADKGGRGSSKWHKVTVLRGANEARDWLVRQLSSRVSQSFEVVNEHVLGDKFLFFVQESAAAMELKEIGTIDSRNGTLTVLVKPSGPPRGSGGNSETRPTFNRGRGQATSKMGGDGDISMADDPKEVIQRVLGERYDTSTKALNLSDMFNDTAFKQSRTRVSMFDKDTVSFILSLIGQYCPDLLSLDLSKNRLARLDLYSSLPTCCPGLETLYLSDNSLRSCEDLQHISGLTKLKSITLTGNPCQTGDRSSYTGSLRKIFPALESVDGHQLSKPVKFDLPVVSGSLPPVRKSYFPNEEVKKVIQTFLEQYYLMYDNDREKLISAYTSDAVFSMTVCTDGPRCPGLREYIAVSRNLKRISDTGRRQSLCKSGHLDIVQFLRSLPNTVHHSRTICVDCVSVNAPLITFVVTGIFSETDGRLPDGKNPIIQFNRMFVLTNVGSGYGITNDQLTLRGPTQQVLKSVEDSTGQQQGFVASPPPAVPDLATTQMQAIQALAAQTRMNVEYSKKCLVENDWDINRALTVFTLLQSEQKIPQEAFM